MDSTYRDEMPDHVLGDLHQAEDRPSGPLTLTPESGIDRTLRHGFSTIVRCGTARGLTATHSPWNPPGPGQPPRAGRQHRSPVAPHPRPTTQARPDARPDQNIRPGQEPTTGLGW